MTPAGIFARRFDSLDCVVQLGIASGRAINVSFPEDVPPDAESDHELLDAVEQYLDGDPTAVDDADIGLTVPTDQRAVLEALDSISPGSTVTVSRLARLAGLDPADDGDIETVRDALRNNPLPIFLPDHRVRDGQGATPPQIAAALRRLENEAS
jgi:methylated-DNA-[protein]-cysteine S-methyltransferase